jgi:hypothetical protein
MHAAGRHGCGSLAAIGRVMAVLQTGWRAAVINFYGGR